MKNHILLLLLFGLIVSCSQQKETEAVNDTINIQLNENAQKIDLTIVALYKDGLDYTRDTSYTDSSGMASFNLQNVGSDRVRLNINGKNLEAIVNPGSRLKIRFDEEEPSASATFNGDLENENTFLNRLSGLYTDYKEQTDYYKVTPDVFIEAINLEKTELNSLLDDSKAELSNKYAAIFEGDINGRWALLNLNYRIRHPYYVKEDSTLVEEMPNYLGGIDLNNGNYIGSAAYEAFLNGFLRNAVSKRDSILNDEAGIAEQMDLTYSTISEVFTDPKIIAFLKSSTVQNLFNYTGINENSEKMFNKLKTEINEEKYLVKTELVFNKWLPLSEGKPAPDFLSEDLDGKKYKLSDLKGKYVYIDVWATWCGPCRREIPYLKKLDSTYHDKNVVFMSVSIDATQEPWRKMVEEEQLKGLQTFTQGAWSSNLCKKYNINGIPRFILIDPNGNIVRANAERPSGKISEILDEKLI